MKISAFVVRSDIRNVVLCGLMAFGLAACGASEGGSSSSGTASAASDSTSSVVSPSVGLVDRSSGTGTPSAVDTTATNVAANTTQSAAPAPSTTPASSATSTSSTAHTSSTTPTSSSTTASTTTPATGTVPATSTTPAPSNNPSTGTVTLDWMPPTENIDGSVLTNLAGYTVYYGTSPGNLTQSLKVTNPGLTAYTVSNLPSGTWYFAVTSYSSTGVESSRSGVVSTTI